ncbi:uncharacterized protein B0H64DRAFT_369209 [Chaetomium fimeti]|uniref:Uncharacterized protein n=1 Tax=Chaetomium fimeti TaxID=1854472 RepID=A0AAE0HNQ4_9PEZI|nr:hypothetical protein B0H64DRAFT_369209 [Chaetomium fimeti]
MPPQTSRVDQQIHDYAASLAITDVFLEGSEKGQVTESQVARVLPHTPGLFHDCLIAIDIMDKIDQLFNIGERSSSGQSADMDTPDESTEDEDLLAQRNFIKTRLNITQYLLRFDVRDSKIPASFTIEFFTRIFDDKVLRARFDDYHRRGPRGRPDIHAVMRGYCIRLEKLRSCGGRIRFTRDRDLPVLMVPLWKNSPGVV